MTKKDFIWLGIRTIGVYWLIRLIFIMIMLLWPLGYSLISMTSGAGRVNIFSTCITSFLQIPVPLILMLYFLFGGTLIYKLISHFIRTRPEDLSKPTDYLYCEIIIRFLGLWCIGLVISRICFSLWVPVQTALIFYFTRPAHFQQQNFGMLFRQYCSIATILSITLYLLTGVIAAWYFLKHGKLFINLLSQLWLKASGKDLNQNPVDPVNPV